MLDAFSSLARTLQDMALILLAKCPLHVGTQLQKPSKQTYPMCQDTNWKKY